MNKHYKHTTKTQSQDHFAMSTHADIQRSVFMRNSSLKTSFNCSDLVPIYLDEVLPSDTFEMDVAGIYRLTTPIFPTMDILNLDIYAFFVPMRLVWDGWEELNGENKTGAWVPQSSPDTVPILYNSDKQQSKKLGDYLGIPIGFDNNMFDCSCLPFRTYALIWNEWFRDQNLQAPLPVNIGSGPDEEGQIDYGANVNLFKTNKKHDYFTSCLPSPQKGESALIPIELNELIPVITTSTQHNVSTGGTALQFRKTDDGSTPPTRMLATGGLTGLVYDEQTTPIQTTFNALKPVNLWADGREQQISGSTISELRTAFQIQKLYERDARGGTRYIEMLKAHFGADAQDYRLQRPEFLGHKHTYVGMQQVAQTSSTDEVSPQGNLSAYSYTADKGTLFKKSFTEHGYIMIFAVARQPKTYQQGLNKLWSRFERLDFYMPVMANISEQPVLVKEIYAVGNINAEEGNAVFGYNEAWADYRYKPNLVTGQMRSDATNTLDNWHYADWYDAIPTLSAEWIVDNSITNVDRTIVIPSVTHDQIYADIAFVCKTTRPMPVNSIPGLVDHH